MYDDVSIHASVKDATEILPSKAYAIICFNPRICKRCDVVVFAKLPALWGFNPRICKRCDTVVTA